MSDQEADEQSGQAVEIKNQRQPKPSTLLAFAPEHLPRLADPYDPHQDLADRVRSYLHANCAICHVESGGGNALMDLEYGVGREKMRIFDLPPQHETFGIADARIVAPGSADRSVLYQRMARRGQGQMPPLATAVPDPKASDLLRQWIETMNPVEIGHKN